MSGTYFALNQKYNTLKNQITATGGGGGGGTADLALVLTNGNSAGSSNIDMSGNDIINVDNIGLTTINGSAYPPAVAVPTLSQVLTAGNSAGSSNINVNNNNITGVTALTFANGTTQRTSAYNAVFLTTSSPTYTLPAGVNVLTISVDNTVTTAILLPTITLIDTGITINTSNTPITLQARTGDVFRGKYGSGVQTLFLPSNCEVVLQSHTEVDFPIEDFEWVVTDKTQGSLYQVSLTSSSTAYATDRSILESIFLISANATGYTFTIPSPVNNRERTLTIANDGANLFNVAAQGGSNILGRYGSGTGTLTILVGTTVELFSNGTNWEVQDKTQGSFYQIPLTSTLTTYAIDRSILESTLAITPAATGYTFFIPTPVSNSDRTLTIVNEGANRFDVSALGGSNFLGRYGSGAGTLTILVGTTVELFSNGTNWEVWNRSGNFVETLAATGSTFSFASNYSICDGTLTITSTSTQSATITIPTPSDSQAINSQIKINNISPFTQTLSIGSGVFNGVFGSGTTSLVIPINSWVKIYSDGIDWDCREISEYGWQYPGFISALNFTVVPITATAIPYGQIYRTYMWGSASVGPFLINMISFNNWNNPTPSQLGLTATFRRIGGVGGNAPQYGMNASLTVGSKKAIYPHGGAAPLTGNASYTFAPGLAYNIRACQVGFKGSGGTTVVDTTTGSKLINLQFSSATGSAGSIAYGTIITIGSPGVDYTVRGLNTWSTGTVSCPAGGVLTGSVVGAFTIGCVFTVAGVEYTVVGLRQDYAVSSTGASNPIPAGSVGISPAVATSFTNAPIVNPGGNTNTPPPPSGGYGGTSNGVYVIEDSAGLPPPVILAGTPWEIKNDVYAWCGV
jgi:hypothetical protein